MKPAGAVKRADRLERRVFSGSTNAVLIGLVVLYAIALAGGDVGFDGLRPVSDQIVDLMWFVMLCGLAAFATIEILKRIFGLRGLFQGSLTRTWLRDRGDASGIAFLQLCRAMGSYRAPDTKRVFNLPTEQLAAQVSSAADRALTEPSHYAALLKALAGEPPAQPEPGSTDRVGRFRPGQMEE